MANSASTGIAVCVSKSDGNLRKMIGKSCKSSEIKETWMTRGEPGIQGPVGVRGIQGPAGINATLPTSATLHIFDGQGNDLGVKFPEINPCFYDSSLVSQTCLSPWDGSILPWNLEGDTPVYFSQANCTGDLLANTSVTPPFPTKYAAVKNHVGTTWTAGYQYFSFLNGQLQVPQSVLWDVAGGSAGTVNSHIVCVAYAPGGHLPDTDNVYGGATLTPTMESGTWHTYRALQALPQFAVPLTFRTVFN